MRDMDIKIGDELYKKKHMAELAIASALNAYATETGLAVTAVSICNNDKIDDDGRRQVNYLVGISASTR